MHSKGLHSGRLKTSLLDLLGEKLAKKEHSSLFCPSTCTENKMLYRNEKMFSMDKRSNFFVCGVTTQIITCGTACGSTRVGS
jgi:hypothetical protein